jgi:transposase, IS5 family
LQIPLFDVSTYDSVYYQSFQNSPLGRIYSSIPFKELTAHFRPFMKQCPQGRKAIFSLEGGLGLMFLKHYTRLSDEKLIERINTDWHYQLFCGLPRRIYWGIKDGDLPGRWRKFLGLRLDLDELQSILAASWKDDLPHKHVCLQDATVYESYIKFPTDVKLLWDCVQWVHQQMELLCKAGKLKKPRFKYNSQKIKILGFLKKRKKTHKDERVVRRSLLRLLSKLLKQIQGLLNQGAHQLVGRLKGDFFGRMKTIRKVLLQQQYHFDQPEKSVPDRIVSLFKPYVRPIKRGKENKPTEFGAKVHQVQVGGCNFIEHLEFKAFHEGIRLRKGVQMQQRLFGPVHQVAADRLYANNRNRKWCTQNNIATCFIPKGPRAVDQKEKDVLRKVLSTIRATQLEGSFGNEKNHYLLKKVQARTLVTEIAWIFFGVHTANAVKIAKIRHLKKQEEQIAYQPRAA